MVQRRKISRPHVRVKRKGIYPRLLGTTILTVSMLVQDCVIGPTLTRGMLPSSVLISGWPGWHERAGSLPEDVTIPQMCNCPLSLASVSFKDVRWTSKKQKGVGRGVSSIFLLVQSTALQSQRAPASHVRKDTHDKPLILNSVKQTVRLEERRNVPEKVEGQRTSSSTNWSWRINC